MPIFTIRATWEEDDNIYRDLIVETGHSFYQLHEVLMQAFEFKDIKPSSFYLSDHFWREGRRISSEVEKNIKNAEALSMKRTPFSALISKPDEKFLYTYDESGKAWTFRLTLRTIKPSEEIMLEKPKISKGEGVAPSKTRAKSVEDEKLTEIDDQYDLNQTSLDEQGFSTDPEES